MPDFAFRSKADRDFSKGKLEVRAKRPSRMGLSDRVIPEGEIGYATRGAEPKTMHVFWPHIEREHKGDWRAGVHSSDDLEPTGKRGS